MNYEKKEIKKGITFHKINTNKFKTNLFAIFLTTKLTRENVTKNALLTAVLRRGTNNLKSQEEISKKLENMYGASFDCGVEKSGDNHILKFYLESINNKFLPNNENISKECMDILLDIVFNPYIEGKKFIKEYVDGEKENLKQIIQGKIDNKSRYALDRCIEEMYKGEPYGLYKYGYVEDLENIDEENLYSYYKELLATVKIDIFASGDNMTEETMRNFETNSEIKNINEREANFIKNNNQKPKKTINEAKIINESMQINQGKLTIGLDVMDEDQESKYATSVYNVILGGSANSKLFQNVREKASLAYTAGSSYLRVKNNIMIRCGIDIENYEKAVKLIQEQLQQMKQGNFTEEDIQNAKTLITATLNGISESQDSELTYCFSQELTDEFVSVEEYNKKINAVTKDQIIKIANNIQTNTIYFLKN